jgi:aspartyl-tRNA(Asn)/glutamyl-tRNA(Gln) amidotransferase subunit C
MSLTSEQLSRLAQLSLLELQEAERLPLQHQLDGVFRLIEQLQAVDTEGVEPLSHTLNLSQRLREDRVTETNRRDLFQGQAPAHEAGLYLVPRVIE